MELTQLGTIEIPHTPRLVRKEDVVKVSFRQGLLLFSCLATFLLAIMVVVVYFGFWLHLYDQRNDENEVLIYIAVLIMVPSRQLPPLGGLRRLQKRQLCASESASRS